MNNNRTMQELNELYKGCPQRERMYEINGAKVIVVGHFIGKKDLSEVIYKNAVDRAMSEMLTPDSQRKSS